VRPWVGVAASAAEGREANSRPRIALIGGGKPADNGKGGRGSAIAKQAAEFADLVAVCDVDRARAADAAQKLTRGRAKQIGDYGDVLASDVDAVLIATPDHWHAKIAIEAMRAGKDVYCEKPLTLTIDEGKQVRKVVRETGRVFQVGTQQRSEYDARFLTAVAMVRSGRLGRIRRVEIGLEKGEAGGPFPPS
jgi:predicted dehydrogenase